MNGEDVQRVIRDYRQLLDGLQDDPGETSLRSDRHALGHCRRMLDDMEIFLDQGRLGKVFRWLGFVQGVFWALEIYTIDELKRHNKRDAE